MEISGYPHYENVCSNILAFYFDPKGEHGLKDLLLVAFLQMKQIDEVSNLGKVTVKREWGTDDRKRIDILIELEKYTIVIENKIYATLYNDLNDYSRAVDNMQGCKIKVVLALHKKVLIEQSSNGFESFTYSELWKCVRDSIGDYIGQANPKWLTYFLEFMQTTTNLAGENMANQKSDEFFETNRKDIDEMFSKRKDFQEQLTKQRELLRDLFEKADSLNSRFSGPRPHSYDTIFFNLLSSSPTIAFDLVLERGEWQLQLFERYAKSVLQIKRRIIHPYLRDLVNKAETVIKDETPRLVVKKWPIGTGLEAIKSDVLECMKSLVLSVEAPSN